MIKNKPPARTTKTGKIKPKLESKVDSSIKRQLMEEFAKDEQYPVQIGWHEQVPWTLPSGIPELDIMSAIDADGGGGLPAGGIGHIFGQGKVAKTGLAEAFIRASQSPDRFGRRPPMLCCFGESEGALISPKRMIQHGIDPNDMISYEPICLEDALDGMVKRQDRLLQMPAEERIPIFEVLDSVSQLAPAEEVNKDGHRTKDTVTMHDPGRMAAIAVILSRFFRRYTWKFRQTKSIVLLISHEKTDIRPGFKAGVTNIGARPIKLAAAIEYRVSRGEDIKRKDASGMTLIGMKCYIKVNMSKVGAPGGRVEVPFYFNSGFDRALSLHKALLRRGVIARAAKGSRYSATAAAIEVVPGLANVKYLGASGISDLEADDVEALELGLIKMPWDGPLLTEEGDASVGPEATVAEEPQDE